MAGKLHDFYHQKLNFKKPSEAQLNRDITYDEVLHRVENEDKDRPDRFLEGSSEEEWEEDEEGESEEEYGSSGQQ